MGVRPILSGWRVGSFIEMRRLLHWLIAKPAIYELVQKLAGTDSLDRRTSLLIGPLTESDERAFVLDVGGGTGRSRRIWPAHWRYVCLDPDPHKSISSNETITRVVGDASKLPLAAGSADVIVMRLMAHHLDDRHLERALEEASKSLRRGGSLLLIDPIWKHRRLLSRFLWRYDVGRHPRTSQALESFVSSRFTVDRTDAWTTLHEFVLVLAHPKPDRRPAIMAGPSGVAAQRATTDL
jgi:SAM-dependent methyltransferase